MEESTLILDHGAIAQAECKSSLETILREGSRRLLQEALELEVQQYVERFQQLKSESGQSLVVRNGYHQERELVTGAGKVPVRQPRVHDRRSNEHFTSAILPPGIVPILVEIAQAPNRYLGTGSRRRNLVSGNNKGACDEQASIPEEARQTHG